MRYDRNGNLTTASGGTYSAIAYTSFNLPDSQSGIAGPGNGGSRYTWLYDESHTRIKEVRSLNGGSFAGTRTTWNLHPDNQGGLGFESEINQPASANGSNVAATSNRHYLSVGGQSIGMIVTTGATPAIGAGTAPPNLAGITIAKLEYWHPDQLGSLVTTTDHTGAVTQRYAYDPFGKRRYTNGVYDVSGNVVVDWSAGLNHGTERGFTGHQQLDEVGLVHMNGRLFDATLGVFLQGDPLIQDPGNLQNYNRYAYCYNNPMGCRDPSGLNFISNAIRIFDPAAYTTVRFLSHSEIGRFALNVANGIGSLFCGPWVGACYGSATAVNASINGYSTSQALRSGVVAGVTAEAFYAVGTYANGAHTADGLSAGQAAQAAGGDGIEGFINGYESSAWSNGGIGRAVLHAAVGCGSGILGDGGCTSGALSAGFSEAASPLAGKAGVAGVLVSAVVGGTAAELGGGKFANGARTGAYGYLFNQAMHGGLERVQRIGTQLGTDAATALGNDSNFVPRISYDLVEVVKITDALDRLATAQGDDFWSSYDTRPERQMLARVIAGSSDSYTLNWFRHESLEASFLQNTRGLSDQEYLVAQQQAHTQALRVQGVTQQQLYLPSVVRQNSTLFGPSYPR